MITIDLTGRTGLVTGAGQGVGRAIALHLADAGAKVFVNDLDADRAQSVVDEISASGGSGATACFDVTDLAAVQAAVDDAPHIDILVNNAGNAGAEGFGGRGTFAESQPADWEPFVRVNFYGAMNCCRAVLPSMITNRWGRLITIVSDAGRVGDHGGAVYGAAKAAAAGLTRSLALENGRYGITANNISLGTMRTPATEPLWADPDSDDGQSHDAQLRRSATRRSRRRRRPRRLPRQRSAAHGSLARPTRSMVDTPSRCEHTQTTRRGLRARPVAVRAGRFLQPVARRPRRRRRQGRGTRHRATGLRGMYGSGFDAAHVALNRGKRSIALDLRHHDAPRVLEKLVAPVHDRDRFAPSWPTRPLRARLRRDGPSQPAGGLVLDNGVRRLRSERPASRSRPHLPGLRRPAQQAFRS